MTAKKTEKEPNPNKYAWIGQWVPPGITTGAVISSFMFLHGEISSISDRMDQSNHRIDRLYEMFVDLLKEGRK